MKHTHRRFIQWIFIELLIFLGVVSVFAIYKYIDSGHIKYIKYYTTEIFLITTILIIVVFIATRGWRYDTTR